jgi:hypothetical protein
MDLPPSDAPFIKAYPAETTEVFLDGHVSALAFLWRRSAIGPLVNIKLASRKYLRRRQARGGCWPSPDLSVIICFATVSGRRRFATPVPVAASLEALKAKLEADCLSELDRSASSCPETIGVRLQADLAAFRWRSGLNQVSVFLKISEPRPLVPLKQ